MKEIIFTILAETSDGTHDITDTIPPSTFWAVFGSIFAVFVVIGLIDAFVYLYKYKKAQKRRQEEIEEEQDVRHRKEREKKDNDGKIGK